MSELLNISRLEKEIAPGWGLTQQSYLADEEAGWETLFTLCNGYVGLRGSLNLPSRKSEAAAFFAGVFDKPDIDQGMTTFGVSGIKSKALAPAMAIAPYWHCLEIEVAGRAVDFLNCQLLEFARTLDMARGLLFSKYALMDAAGWTTEVRTLSLLSRADLNYAYLQVEITSRNYSAPVTVRLLDQVQTTPDYIPRLRDYIARTRIMQLGEEQGVSYLDCRVEETGVEIMLASTTQGDHPMYLQQRSAAVAQCCHFQTQPGKTMHLQKHIAFATSLDEHPVKVRAEVCRAMHEGITARFSRHCALLADLWAVADVSFTGDDETQQGVRWDIFNLIQLGDPVNSNHSIGATGLHGQGYFGHVFWDTELFMLPFYLACAPLAARNLLLYRYKRLDAARENAREAGLTGAKFPWTSSWQGFDVTPYDWRASSGREIHVNGAIAYACWNYWRWTGDDDFYRQYGIEMIVETAKFWSSFAIRDDDGRFHINDIVGPDEYNIHANDNYYTNKLAQWNINEALRAMHSLREEAPQLYQQLAAKVAWNEALISRLQEIAVKLDFPHVRDGVCEQYRGFFELTDVAPMQRGAYFMPLSNGHAFNSLTQMSKQADVVMMHFLFENDFPPEVKRASYQYYDTRCNHGSSLSPAIYSIMGLKVGLPRYAYGYFQLTALLDLKNLHIDKNLREGIHAACAGGTWMAAVYGFGGVSLSENLLVIAPRLPEEWSTLTFAFRYCGRIIRVEATHEKVIVKLTGEALTVQINDKVVEILAH